MDQLLFSLQNSLLTIQHSIVLLLRNHITWAFLLGFCAATAFHIINMVERPSDLKHIISKDPATSYSRIAKQKEDGTYELSYAAYKEKYDRLKTAFTGTLFLISLVLVFSIARITA